MEDEIYGISKKHAHKRVDSDKLVKGNNYIVQHGVNKVLAKVEYVHHKIRPDYSGIDTELKTLEMNDIAKVSFKLSKAIFYDKFKDHRTNGSFILIDTKTNSTVGAGFIE